MRRYKNYIKITDWINGRFFRLSFIDELSVSGNSDFSRSKTTVASDTTFESDYVTGLEDFPNEKTEVKKPRPCKKLFKGLNNPCQTSSFIQNILSEDSKTGVAVVDLFVAVKAIKDNLDFLVRKNDDVLHQIDALNAESGIVKNEYQNLAEDMRSFLNELNDETIIERHLSHKYDPEKCDTTQEKPACDQMELLRHKCSKNAVGYLDCLASTLKRSTKDRPRISKTLLGSFLASMLWLKKREALLSNSDREVEPSITDSSVQMICDMCEMLGATVDSASEDGWSETEERNSFSQETSCKESSGLDNDSDSAFDEAFATPPPSPPSSFFELKPKRSVTCMDNLTKEDKNKNVTGTYGSIAPIAVFLMKKIKSAVKRIEPKEAVATDDVITKTAEELEKFPQTVEFTIAASTTAGAFDIMVRKQQELQSYSSDSLENFTDFDSDDVATSSLSGGDEMEEFEPKNAATLNPDSKAMRPRGDNVLLLETFKTPKPTFFEVLKFYPKLFIQEMVSRSPKIKSGANWETREQDNAQLVAVVTGEKREQEVVIENNNLDLVIYIQVEVEDDDKKEQLVLDFETNSFGTQTSSHANKFPVVEETSESEKRHNISRTCQTQESEQEPEKTSTINSDENIKVHDGKKAAKMVAFAEDVSEIFIKTNIPCEPEKTENAVTVTLKEEILTANIYFEQLKFCPMCLIERPKPFYRQERNVELEKALELIHEIENDVVDTKLSDAILILPRLESELRKHFKQKVKSLGESEFSKSFETFFTAFDVWPVEVTNDTGSEGSGERFYNLLAVLGDLEKAVKASECSTEEELCTYDSSKIYGLLHALTENIRELEDCSNVSSLSQTLDVASQVDTAIREFESIFKRTPTEYTEKSKKQGKRLQTQTSGEISEHLKNVRKRVFQMVEEEAVDTEARLERDSDKLLRLERQNDEAMKFVEAFLEKTQRRASELSSVKEELKELSKSIANMYEQLKTKTLRKEMSEKEEAKKEELDTSTHDVTLEPEEPVKETVSGLLLALDKLKSRARKKNELCKEILSSVSFEKEIKEHDASTRSSRSSFTAKNVEGLYSWVKDFKKIGDQNLYLSWTMPESPLADSLAGYEIFVNGKLNQKVRNPKRLQAILYSVDLSQMAEVQLYGLLENGFKIFLASVTYMTS